LQARLQGNMDAACRAANWDSAWLTGRLSSASNASALEGVKLIRYDLHREPSKQAHHYVRPLEAGVLHGQAVARMLLKLKAKGFVPDVVIAHPGWGEALYVKDVFPRTRLISFFEFFYHPEGADCGFDPEFPVSFDDRTRIRSKNALHLMNLEACDIGISPTQWQKEPAPHGISQQNRSDPRRHRHRHIASRSGCQFHLVQWCHLACRSADCHLRRA
jgi:hypothetical protein